MRGRGGRGAPRRRRVGNGGSFEGLFSVSVCVALGCGLEVRVAVAVDVWGGVCEEVGG